MGSRRICDEIAKGVKAGWPRGLHQQCAIDINGQLLPLFVFPATYTSVPLSGFSMLALSRQSDVGMLCFALAALGWSWDVRYRRFPGILGGCLNGCERNKLIEPKMKTLSDTRGANAMIEQCQIYQAIDIVTKRLRPSFPGQLLGEHSF